MTERILRSGRVVADSRIAPATIHIHDGRIARVSSYDDLEPGATLEDFGELVLLPGVVDSHVHVNEPGRTEWEGFETATRAAAAGGVTTIVDMPLNSIPPTTTVAALLTKAEAMDGKCRVDVGLWGGAVPGNEGVLRAMLDEGALGFKCFLVDSGVPEFRHLDEDGLARALATLRGTGAPLLVHAELPGPIERAADTLQGEATSYRRWLDSRPHQAEDEAIALVDRHVRASGAEAHIVHLSSADALDTIRRARDTRIGLTAETTPHYLYFVAETIPDGAPEYKCAPPIRERDNRERLWRAVREGTIAGVVSDHSPCTPELKHLDAGDVERAWGGIASLQFGLPIVWTEGRRRGLSLADVSQLLSAGPALIARIGDRKGRLAPGYDADIIAFDPDAPLTITPECVEHRHKVTPYTGAALSGVVRATYLRGEKIFANGTHVGPARGRWVRRNGER
jgi:allantoinase